MSAVEIVDGGPLGRPYPIVRLEGMNFHRRYGSWMAELDGGALAEPVRVGVDPEDLQELPEVKAFDKRRRAAAAVEREAAASAEPETREWVKGDKVMWAGSKARVIGPSREPGKVRIKANRKVHHVDPAGLTERAR